MRAPSPLWPARLDHLRIDVADVAASVAFYRDVIGMNPLALEDGTTLMRGPARRIVIGRGPACGQPWSAFAVETPTQLASLRAHAEGHGLAPLASPSPAFADGAFALRDPDGRLVVFGLPRADLPAPPHAGFRPVAAALAGRLQHVVVASARLDAMLAFYRDALGFVASDYVEEGGNRAGTACFLRSDPEHHSFAVFRAPEPRPDHHCYEATSWNDLRDWADHLARNRVTIWWGPGRHGPGNNLFLMARDPGGYLFEISAELEIMPLGVAPRRWPHEERTLNLWGPGWMRS